MSTILSHRIYKKEKTEKILFEEWVAVVSKFKNNLNWGDESPAYKKYFVEDPDRTKEVASTKDDCCHIHYNRIFGEIVVRFDFEGQKAEHLEICLTLAEGLNSLFEYNFKKVFAWKDLNAYKLKMSKQSLFSEPVLNNSFGNNDQWMAIKSEDPKKVIRYFKFKKVKEILWDGVVGNLATVFVFTQV